MVDIQSKEVIDKISDELKIQPAMQIPRGIGKDIQLIYNVNILRRINSTTHSRRISTGSNTILTTPTDRDFFLVGTYIDSAMSATADSTEMIIVAEPETGGSVTINSLNKITLTAFTGNNTIMYPIPIKLRRGSTIVLTHTFTVGSGFTTGIIYAYVTDPQ